MFKKLCDEVFLRKRFSYLNEMMRTLKINASVEDRGERVDSFLAKTLEGFSRAQIAHFIKDGHLLLEQKVIKASYKILGSETIYLTVPPVQAARIEAENIPLDIIYSDDEIAVINKPVNLVVHPGAGVKTGTLCHALLFHFPNMVIGNEERPGIVHRLDKDTSGVMVIAKTHAAHQCLSEDFKNRRVKKIYRAFVHGSCASTSFELITGHARHPQNRLRFTTKIPVPLEANEHVRRAHSSFIVEKSAYGISSLKVELHTGRTHQIRAHLSDTNHPLLGDYLYGGKRSLNKNMPLSLADAIDALSGQALHAETLIFPHPRTKEIMSFSAPLSRNLAKIDDELSSLA